MAFSFEGVASPGHRQSLVSLNAFEPGKHLTAKFAKKIREGHEENLGLGFSPDEPGAPPFAVFERWDSRWE